MKKIICVLLFLGFCGVAFGGETHGYRKLYSVIIETRDKEAVIKRLISDMQAEKYSLVDKSNVAFTFDSPVRDNGKFGFNLSFNPWGTVNRGDNSREWIERRPPVYRLEFTVVKKTIESVEVEVCPIFVWNPGIAYQKDIYDSSSSTEKILKNYLNSLKEAFNNVS